jgi:hypothetical protein
MSAGRQLDPGTSRITAPDGQTVLGWAWTEKTDTPGVLIEHWVLYEEFFEVLGGQRVQPKHFLVEKQPDLFLFDASELLDTYWEPGAQYVKATSSHQTLSVHAVARKGRAGDGAVVVTGLGLHDEGLRAGDLATGTRVYVCPLSSPDDRVAAGEVRVASADGKGRQRVSFVLPSPRPGWPPPKELCLVVDRGAVQGAISLEAMRPHAPAPRPGRRSR